MQEITEADYLRFLAQQKAILVGGSEIRLLGHHRPRNPQPEEFKTETTTLWSFPRRGRWATHKSGYRGN